MELIDVVKKLIGPVFPMGSYDGDMRCSDNLGDQTKLIARLVEDVVLIARLGDNHQASVKQVGCQAQKFLVELLATLVEED